MNELEVAKQAATVSGAVIAKQFREGARLLEDTSRESQDLVSEADVASEKIIVDLIRNFYPKHSILAEESEKGNVDTEHLWIVDPLDGTNNYAHGIPHFAVSIAYYHCGQAKCAVVFNPIRNDWFTAVSGKGAYHNEHKIRVSDVSRLDRAMIGVGFYYDRGAMMQATLDAIGGLFRQKIHGIRRFGAASLDLCFVACGMLDGFFEYELSPWDFAAGRLIINEAGGEVTRCDGTELPLCEKSTMLATNKRLHESMLAIVKTHLPS